jgi:lipopolysaccharide/colanic/teichoic acid biosynthesis glycosyltransferase
MLMRTFMGGGLAARMDRVFRAVDVSGAAFAILFVLPLGAVLSLLIVCEGPGPIVVRWRRARVDGTCYDLLAFRTRRESATLSDIDAPFSKIGEFLCLTGLDEIPALVNIFKGDLPICGRFSWRQVIVWLFSHRSIV